MIPALSLCSGYGGLDLAVEAALGTRTVAFCEIETAPTQVFTRHWPDAQPLGDLTAVDWTAWTGQIDVVSAGFPCQDLSYAGKGAGITEGTRSGLWYAIEDLLGVVRPRVVVLENVAAIVTRRPGLDVVLAGLARLGFDAEWACVRASAVGAPHRRERWFCVAYADGSGLEGAEPAGGRLLPAGRRGAAADSGGSRAGRDAGAVPRAATAHRRQGADIRAAIHDRGTPADPEGVGHERSGQSRRRETGPADSGDAPADAQGRERSERDGDDVRARSGPHGRSEAAGGGASADADGGRRQERLQQHSHTPPHPTDGRSRGGHADGHHPQAWGDYTPAIDRWGAILGRPAPPPTDDRGRLAPAFVEWMMGLPDGWVTATPGLSRNQQLKALGNGVVPQQAYAALVALTAASTEEDAA